MLRIYVDVTFFIREHLSVAKRLFPIRGIRVPSKMIFSTDTNYLIT